MAFTQRHYRSTARHTEETNPKIIQTPIRAVKHSKLWQTV
uniref:Uncharacterized protein n=1 Tax=Anguilla anguilla TaxID=7936 RepID=A0A0E9SJY3_ANGAN